MASGTSWTPGDEASGSRLRVVATFRDGDGVLEQVTSDPTQAVVNVNDAASGRPGLSTTTPVVGDRVLALTGPIADPDGVAGVTFRFQWQQRSGETWRDIAGAIGPSFTPHAAQ